MQNAAHPKGSIKTLHYYSMVNLIPLNGIGALKKDSRLKSIGSQGKFEKR